MSLPDPADLEPGDDKARAALARFSIRRVTSAAGADFEEAFGALAQEFGPRGELERREVVSAWLARGDGPIAQAPLNPPEGGKGSGAPPQSTERRVGEGGPLRWRYGLLIARDADGVLAGVRDCHVTVDVARRECVVYLAHTLVLPPYRRGGLASLFRAAPITLARRAVSDAGLARADVLLAAEMEPADLDARDTIVRLIAYGRAGFRALPPAVLPYCQADFRVLAPGEPARPLPLLAIVRWLDHAENALPRRLCEAYVRHLYAVFATHCRPADLERPMRHALAALAVSGCDPVPLLPLPRAEDDTVALAPLLREATLRHHRQMGERSAP